MNELRARTLELLARWRDSGGSAPAQVHAADLERVFAASEFVAGAAIREPALLSDLAAGGELGRARAGGEIRAGVMALLEAGDDEAGFMDSCGGCGVARWCASPGAI